MVPRSSPKGKTPLNRSRPSIEEIAVAREPGSAARLNDLGNARRVEGRLAAASTLYTRAARLDPEAVWVRFNLASLLNRMRRPEEAERAFAVALALDPAHAGSHNNRAILLADIGRTLGSALGYLRAATCRPEWDDAHDNLADALYALRDDGGVDDAIRLARVWRRDHPDQPTARHIGAAITGEAGEPRAPDAYVKGVFDSFADDFDRVLAGLDYRAPERLIRAIRRRFGPLRRPGDTLDAGCGTGLCGPLLRPLSRTLTGVDLSPGMLERARERETYDALEEAELVSWIAARPASLDLIVATDVFCYFGALHEALRAIRVALRPRGILGFTVEAATDAGEEGRVGPSGRYAHGERAVRRALEGAGFGAVKIGLDTLRTEGGVPVAGLIVTARAE